MTKPQITKKERIDYSKIRSEKRGRKVSLNQEVFVVPGGVVFDVFSFIYNEPEILKVFLEHYKNARTITIYDNQSSVDYTSIVKRYPNTKLVEWDTGGSFDDNALTEMKNTCWKDSDADWVVVCDLDELLFSALPETADYIETIAYDVSQENYEPKLDHRKLRYIRSQRYDKSVAFKPEVGMVYARGAHRAKVAKPGAKPGRGYLLHLKYYGHERTVTKWLSGRVVDVSTYSRDELLTMIHQISLTAKTYG